MHKRLLHEIERHIAREGMSPSLRELAETIGMTFQGDLKNVRRLEEKGYVRRIPGKSRSLVVLRSVGDIPSVGLVPILLLKTIATGTPIFSAENRLGDLMIDAATVQTGQYFALKVTSSNTIDAKTPSSTILVVRQQPLAEHGDIVVALLNGEATVKCLHLLDGQITLVSENMRHKPIHLLPEDDFRILGKVVCVRQSDRGSLE